MFSKIISGSLLGVDAILISVEVDVSNGLPYFSMVGCPGSEVRESKERVFAALKNTGLSAPSARITVNLSPADIHKEGTSYDLPIAVALLLSCEILPKGCTENCLIAGELGLNGEIKPIRGVLSLAKKAADEGIGKIIIPAENAKEGAVIPGIDVIGVSSLKELFHYLKDPAEYPLSITKVDAASLLSEAGSNDDSLPDFNEVHGQAAAKRASMISAAGFHSMLMTGPPGVGKSLIAKRIPTILPPLSLEEALEITAVYSVAGKLSSDKSLITSRGFEAPHHSLTLPALIGGGANPRPGAVSMAHRSVLFLDELTEFDRKSIDSLRQPLEDHIVNISRANYSVTYPADFLLICAMNPCPCGYYPDRNRCNCTEPVLRKYLSKISGPILDRIDLCVEMTQVKLGEMGNVAGNESSESMRSKVMKAREMQKKRYADTAYRFNSEVSGTDIEGYCNLGDKESKFLKSIYEKFSLSLRSYHRILRVSRTIADLSGSENVLTEHILEAVNFRPNFEYWRNL